MTLGLQQAPGVAKAMWPSGTTDSKFFQISALDTQLSASVQQLTDIIDGALKLIMSDVPTFVNFADSGMFSGHESLSLPNTTTGLDFALKTYMTSESLLQNGWFGAVMGTFTPEQTYSPSVFGPQCANVTGGVICSETGDSSQYDQSGGLFWSERSNRQYLLSKHSGDAYSYPILNAINANGWADLATLFDGSYDCTFEGMIPSLTFSSGCEVY